MASGAWERRLRAIESDPSAAWDVIRRRYLHSLFVDRGGGPEDAIFVAGSARSGTTWLADLINFDNSYRYIFEPFRPGKVALTREFGTRRYLPPSDDDPSLVRTARAALSGEVRSQWTDQFNRQVLPRRRLVKDVWSNLMLGWLHHHFPEVPFVLILRHPCAVVSSQLRLATWRWEVDVDRLLAQPELVRDHLSVELCEDIAASSTPFDRHLVTWCVETLVPLRQFGPGQLFVGFYERFCSDPRAELGRLFRFLGRPFDARAMARVDVPSAAARPSFGPTAAFAADSWVRRVDRHQVTRATEILGRFGLDHLYGEEPMPLLRDPDEALLSVGGPG